MPKNAEKRRKTPKIARLIPPKNALQQPKTARSPRIAGKSKNLPPTQMWVHVGRACFCGEGSLAACLWSCCALAKTAPKKLAPVLVIECWLFAVPLKTPNPTTTDPTPHLRPSELLIGTLQLESSAIFLRLRVLGTLS